MKQQHNVNSRNKMCHTWCSVISLHI